MVYCTAARCNHIGGLNSHAKGRYEEGRDVTPCVARVPVWCGGATDCPGDRFR